MKVNLNLKKLCQTKSLILGLLLAALYLITYFVSRYATGSTTADWTARHFLLIAAIITCIPAFFGCIKYAYISYAGYIIGIIAGDLFGGLNVQPPSYFHYGWIICIMVFMAISVAGIVVELICRHKSKENV